LENLLALKQRAVAALVSEIADGVVFDVECRRARGAGIRRRVEVGDAHLGGEVYVGVVLIFRDVVVEETEAEIRKQAAVDGPVGAD